MVKRSLACLLWLMLVVGGAGCGSKTKTAAKTATPPTSSPTCASMAIHVGGNVAEGGDGRDIIEKVMRESCEADAWSADAIDCLSKSSADLTALVPEQPRSEQLAGCGGVMTDAQLEGVSARFTAVIDARSSSN